MNLKLDLQRKNSRDDHHGDNQANPITTWLTNILIAVVLNCRVNGDRASKEGISVAGVRGIFIVQIVIIMIITMTLLAAESAEITLTTKMIARITT